MLRKTKTYGSISFLDSVVEKVQDEQIKVAEEKRIEEVAEEQKSRKLNNKDDGYKSSRSIMSAQTGSIDNLGGHSKFTKCKTSNSVWGEQEVSKPEEKAQIDNKISKKSIENFMEKEFKKNNEVRIATNQTAIVFPDNSKNSNFRSAKEGISLFDTEDFARLPEKSAGEKLSKDLNEKKSKKDESWKNSGRAVSSQDFVDRLFDNITD